MPGVVVGLCGGSGGWTNKCWNFAISLGPSNRGFGLVERAGKEARSTSFGCVRARFAPAPGSSSHWDIRVSCPCPNVRFGCRCGWVRGTVIAFVREGLLETPSCCRSRAGSPEWVGHVAHGNPHGHCQSRTKRFPRLLLHQVRLSRLSRAKAGRVPSARCGQTGHCNKKRSGMGVELCTPSVDAVLVADGCVGTGA